jgi:hypothetical protein
MRGAVAGARLSVVGRTCCTDGTEAIARTCRRILQVRCAHFKAKR